MENQQKIKESKKYTYPNHLNSTLENKEDHFKPNRPMTSRYGVAGTGLKKDSLQASMEVKHSTGVYSGAQTSRNHHFKARNTEGITDHNRSYDYWAKGVNPGESYFLHNYREDPKQESQTDRKLNGSSR